MAFFVISWLDKPDAFELRASTREAHLAHIAAHAEQVRLAGPFLDDQGRMIGSMIIFEAEDIEAARAFHEADPYKAAGLFDSSTIRPWRASIGGLAPVR